MVGPAGFEPAICRLGGGRSVLLSYEPLDWRPQPESNRRVPLCRQIPSLSGMRPSYPRPDSNGRPPPSEGGALSICATRARVGESGIEPPRQRLRLYGPLSSPPAQLTVGALRDSNPPLSCDTGSQPAPSATWVKAPVRNAGLEPAHPGVWDRSSAAELIAHEHPRQDSNLHPSGS